MGKLCLEEARLCICHCEEMNVQRWMRPASYLFPPITRIGGIASKALALAAGAEAPQLPQILHMGCAVSQTLIHSLFARLKIRENMSHWMIIGGHSAHSASMKFFMDMWHKHSHHGGLLMNLWQVK